MFVNSWMGEIDWIEEKKIFNSTEYQTRKIFVNTLKKYR